MAATHAESWSARRSPKHGVWDTDLAQRREDHFGGHGHGTLAKKKGGEAGRQKAGKEADKEAGRR